MPSGFGSPWWKWWINWNPTYDYPESCHFLVCSFLIVRVPRFTIVSNYITAGHANGDYFVVKVVNLRVRTTVSFYILQVHVDYKNGIWLPGSNDCCRWRELLQKLNTMWDTWCDGGGDFYVPNLLVELLMVVDLQRRSLGTSHESGDLEKTNGESTKCFHGNAILENKAFGYILKSTDHRLAISLYQAL